MELTVDWEWLQAEFSQSVKDAKTLNTAPSSLQAELTAISQDRSLATLHYGGAEVLGAHARLGDEVEAAPLDDTILDASSAASSPASVDPTAFDLASVFDWIGDLDGETSRAMQFPDEGEIAPQGDAAAPASPSTIVPDTVTTAI